MQNEDEALAVGGPGEIVDVLNGLGEALGFAAHAVEEPNLRLAFVALGEEGEILSVGAPAGMRRRNFFGGHDGIGIAAGGRGHPDAGLGLVFL